MYKCTVCDSTDVEQKAWVQLNCHMPKIDCLDSGDKEDYWCNNCDEHTYVQWEENEN